MANAKRIAGTNSRELSVFRELLFYGISLLLSLIIIVISVTVFIVAIYFVGSLDRNFLILFVVIVAINLIVSGLSLLKLFRLIVLISIRKAGNHLHFNRNPDPEMRETTNSLGDRLTGEFFTDTELAILDLLKENNDRMIQSIIVSSMNTSKASVSRALTSLEAKGVIIRLRKGVTNEVILSEDYA